MTIMGRARRALPVSNGKGAIWSLSARGVGMVRYLAGSLGVGKGNHGIIFARLIFVDTHGLLKVCGRVSRWFTPEWGPGHFVGLVQKFWQFASVPMVDLISGLAISIRSHPDPDTRGPETFLNLERSIEPRP